MWISRPGPPARCCPVTAEVGGDTFEIGGGIDIQREAGGGKGPRRDAGIRRQLPVAGKAANPIGEGDGVGGSRHQRVGAITSVIGDQGHPGALASPAMVIPEALDFRTSQQR